jgi:DNA-binding PadR family transcriptional regulator
MVVVVATAQGDAAMKKRALTTHDVVVLGMLTERSFHGYELVRELELRDARDWAQISRPQVYYSLKKLHAMRLVRSSAEVGQGPDRRTYMLTESGADALRAALEREAWATQRPPPPFLTWFCLALHASPEGAAKLVARRRTFLDAEIEREEATLASFDGEANGPMLKVGRAVVTLTIAQMRLERDWLAVAAAALSSDV